MHIARRAGLWAVAALTGILAASRGTAQDARAPAPQARVLREERTVDVNGTTETWRLEWAHPPGPICPPDDPGWFTCPCSGFEFGEEGELDLVRSRSSGEIDRLHVTPLFSNDEVPAPASEKGHAALRRFPVLASDLDAWERADQFGSPAAFQEAVVERTVINILDLRDFNLDGSATEFVLQIGVLPCGKRQSVLVGISPSRPGLHAFGSAEHPDRPLVLYVDHWEKLRTSTGPLRIVTWSCGDHASEVHEELLLKVDEIGIHAARETYSCGEPGQEHGELISREIL